MENLIIQYLEKYDMYYIKIDNTDDIKIIYDLFSTETIMHNDVTKLSSIVLNYYGIFNKIKNNNKETEKYYKLAIEKGSIIAIQNLASHYDDQENYETAEKYYKMSYEKSIPESIFILAKFYDDRKKFEEAEKYYKLCIENIYKTSANNRSLNYIDL